MSADFVFLRLCCRPFCCSRIERKKLKTNGYEMREKRSFLVSCLKSFGKKRWRPFFFLLLLDTYLLTLLIEFWLNKKLHKGGRASWGNGSMDMQREKGEDNVLCFFECKCFFLLLLQKNVRSFKKEDISFLSQVICLTAIYYCCLW